MTGQSAWNGGMMSRLYWQTGRLTDMNDPAAPWPAFPDAVSAFYANEAAVERFFDTSGAWSGAPTASRASPMPRIPR